MANLIQISGRQIKNDAITNDHINTAAGIQESKLNLNFPTSDLNQDILDFQAKKNLLFVEAKGITFTPVNGTTNRISPDMTATVAAVSFYGTMGGNASTAGMVTDLSDPSNNKVQVRVANTGQPLESAANGPDVYGRMIDASPLGKWVDLFYTHATTGVETAFNMEGTTPIVLDLLLPESYNLADIPFNSFATGVSFVDGLPAVHVHHLADVIDVSSSPVALNDVATLTALAKSAVGDSGAMLIGFDNDNLGLAGAPTTIQAAIDELGATVATLGSTGGGSGVPFTNVTPSEVPNGIIDTFTVDAVKQLMPGSVAVYVNSGRQGLDQVTINAVTGKVVFATDCIPATGDVILFDYRQAPANIGA